ncbi:MAG: glycosyltransferase family 4 protein [Sphingobacteriales bacterium]|nr:glycosyltransferase family 4 protein [Sphingobacteriales bacterium]OJY81900.1 MAG: hypothetical protein BGP14_03830 [Sphingobacteriales bacterium 44-15]
MKIAVNTRLLRKNKMDGIGWFTYNTLKKITVEHPEIEFHFFFDSGVDNSFIFSDNIIPHNLFPPAKHAILNIAWFEVSVKTRLKHINPDLFLSPDGILCLGWAGRQYGVIHDLNFYHMPEVLKFSNRKYYNYYFPKFAEKAARIGTVSNFSKEDITQNFGIDQAKIDVLYNGINDFFTPCDDETIKKTRLHITNGEPYFVFTGSLSPRKNILRLMQAFDLYKQITKSSEKLVIAGSNLYRAKALRGFKEKMLFGKDVLFTGHISNAEMNNIVGSALAMVFVPVFEGFGIPPLEAMQCNIPVIASNTTSVPEITGDAALLVDPYNIDDIARAMISIKTDEALRDALILRGNLRKSYFSWDKTSDLLWDSFNKIM